MAKVAEKLTILLSHADALFSRMHRVETHFRYLFSLSPLQHSLKANAQKSNAKTAPPILSDKAFARVADALNKAFPRFPAEPAKVPGYEELVSRQAQALYETFGSFYYVFVDLLDWTTAARECILEVGKGCTVLKYDVNPTTSQAFLDLVQCYTRLLAFMQKIGDRQLILGLYGRAYYHVKYVNEPSYERVADFVAAYADAVPRIQADLRAVGSQVADCLMTFYMPYIQNVDVANLRAQGVHSLTMKPEQMKLPSDYPQLVAMMQHEAMYMRLAWGLLVLGDALIRVGADLLGAVLQEGLWVPIYRDVCTNVHVLYGFMIKNYKLPKKSDMPADMLKEVTNTMAKMKRFVTEAEKYVESGEMVARHASRRVYLRHELGSLGLLMSDTPGLLGPKLTLVLSALAYAKMEIMWLLRHQCTPLPKNSKLKSDDFGDSHLTELLYVTHRLESLVLLHQPLIRAYYAAFLQGLDVTMAQRELGAHQVAQNGRVRPLLDAIVTRLLDDGPALRLNWFRAEAYLSNAESQQFLEPAKAMDQRFTTISRHSEYVDGLPALLARHCTLGDLWYFREGFKAAFVAASSGGGPTQPSRTIVYLQLLQQMALAPNPACPDEHASRSRACALMAKAFVERLALCINNGLVTIAHHFATLDDQLTETNAAYSVLCDLPSWKPPKEFVPPIPPGQESLYSNRQALDKLRATQSTVFQLCSVLNTDVALTVGATTFVPREFLRDRLAQTLSEFVGKRATVAEGQIERPMLLERRLASFCAVFVLVENHLDLNLSSVFRQTLLTHVYQPHLSELGAPMAPIGVPLSDWEPTLSKALVAWYVDFCASHLLQGDHTTVIWCPPRKAFVSRAGLPFRAEEYVSLVELKAICRLLGPYGIKALDGEVLRLAASSVRELKKTLVDNRGACGELQKSFHDAALEPLNVLKTFKGLEAAVQQGVGLGLLLTFRRLVHEALGQVMEQQVPALHRSVACAVRQYPPNLFAHDPLVPCDLVAAACGLDVGVADQALRAALREAIGATSEDAALWSLFPTLCTAALLTKPWAEADYRPAPAAYRTNLHCFAPAVAALVVTSKALTSPTRTSLELQVALELFVEQSSRLLLRASLVDPKMLQRLIPLPAPSLVAPLVFLDAFVEEAPYLHRETLERVLPYALLRSYYSQLYSTPALAKTRTTQPDGI